VHRSFGATIRTSSATLLAATVGLAVIAAPRSCFAQSHEGPDPTPANLEEESTRDVWVHVEAPEGVQLLQQSMDGAPWRTSCSAPCDVLLPTAARYQVSRGGLHPSAVFRLQAPPGTQETLVVDDPSRTVHTIGVVGLASSPLLSTVGFLVTFSAASGDGPNPPAFHAGLFMMGAGVVALIGGVALLASGSGSAKVDQIYEGHLTRSVASRASSQSPVWSTATAEPRSWPPVMGIPIVSGRF
jgi:hypothetical protein